MVPDRADDVFAAAAKVTGKLPAPCDPGTIKPNPPLLAFVLTLTHEGFEAMVHDVFDGTSTFTDSPL